jgi:REP element-mobilizing transposase RayT
MDPFTLTGLGVDARSLAWLDRLGDGESLSAMICRLKANAARCVRREIGGHMDAVWARGFHDRALRREEDVLHAARYVVMNPIRAGLVKRMGDYPYWNAIWL